MGELENARECVFAGEAVSGGAAASGGAGEGLKQLLCVVVSIEKFGLSHKFKGSLSIQKAIVSSR